MLRSWPAQRRENGHVTEVFSNGERMVMLRRWSVQWRENGPREVVSLMEREWSCYGGCQFKGGRMVMLQTWSV